MIVLPFDILQDVLVKIAIAPLLSDNNCGIETNVPYMPGTMMVPGNVNLCTPFLP